MTYKVVVSLMLVSCTIFVSAAWARNPEISPLLANHSPDVPLQLRVTYLQSQSVAERAQLQEWSYSVLRNMGPGEAAALVNEWEARKTDIMRRYGYDGRIVGNAARYGSPRYLAATFVTQIAGTYDSAFSAMLLRSRQDRVRLIVNQPFKNKIERDNFVTDFLAIDFNNLAHTESDILSVDWETERLEGPRFQQAGVQHLVAAMPYLMFLYQEMKARERDAKQDEVNRKFFERLDGLQQDLRMVRSQQQLDGVEFGKTLGNVNGHLAAMDASVKESAHIQRQMDNVQREHVAHSKAMANTLASIQVHQQAILDRVDSNTELQRSNQELLRTNLVLSQDNAVSLAYLKTAAYGGLSTRDQLVWMEARQLPIKESVRVKEIERLKQTLVTEDVGTYLKIGEGGIAALEKLGVSGETMKAGREVVKRASQVNDVLKAALSGNPMSIAGAVLGMLMGPDAAELRHQELMREFEKVHQKLAEIEAKIDVLTELTKKQHTEVMERFDKLTNDVLTNRRLLTWLVSQDLRHLRSAVDQACENGLVVLNDPNLSNDISRGITALINCVQHKGNRNTFAPMFLLLPHGIAESKLYDRFAAERIVPASQLFDRLTKSEDGDERRRAIANLAGVGVEERVELAFDELLSADDVIDLAQLVDDFAPILLQLTVENGRYVARADKTPSFSDSAWSKRRNDVLAMYRKSLYLLNVAIAQQSLLSGDCWVHRLDGHWSDPDVASLLKSNPYIRENATLHVVRKSGISELAYTTFLDMRHTSYFEKAIPPFHFTHCESLGDESNWRIHLAPELESPMPGPASPFNGFVARTAVHNQLLEMRTHMANGLAELETTPTDRENVLLWAILAR